MTKNLFEALIKFQSMVVSVPKNKTVKMKSFNYSYADLGDIMSITRKPLIDCGLGIIQFITEENSFEYLVTKLIHISGESFESKMKMRTIGATSQELGSAITYARRYAICCLLGIVADDDTDDVRAPDAQITVKKVEYMTYDDAQLIMELIAEDKERFEKMNAYLQANYGTTNLEKVPKSAFEILRQAAIVKHKNKDANHVPKG